MVCGKFLRIKPLRLLIKPSKPDIDSSIKLVTTAMKKRLVRESKGQSMRALLKEKSSGLLQNFGILSIEKSTLRPLARGLSRI